MTQGPILAVDDNPIELELLERCHQRAAVPQPLRCFEDPDALVDYVRAALDGKHPWPDYVLVDVRMTLVDGFELVERLQAMAPALSHIAMFTTSQHPQDAERARQLGVGLFTKPIGLSNYVAFLQQLSATGHAGQR